MTQVRRGKLRPSFSNKEMPKTRNFLLHIFTFLFVITTRVCIKPTASADETDFDSFGQTHIHNYIYIHTFMYTYRPTYTYTHTHVHTYTQFFQHKESKVSLAAHYRKL